MEARTNFDARGVFATHLCHGGFADPAQCRGGTYDSVPSPRRAEPRPRYLAAMAGASTAMTAQRMGRCRTVTDHAYGSIDVTAQTAKFLIDAYYGQAPDRSYFVGCSTGAGHGVPAELPGLPMALAQGVGVLVGLNERTGGLLSRMALAMRSNLTGRRKWGQCRSRSGANGWGRFGGGSAVDGIMKCRSRLPPARCWSVLGLAAARRSR
jgi:hypothetical protein